MKISASDEFLAVAVCLTAVIVGGLILLFAWTVWQRDAVNQGHAEFYLDKDFNRQWRWRTNCTHDVWKEKP